MCLVVEDDRGAVRLAVGAGGLAVGALAAGFVLAGSALPGLVATASLLLAVLVVSPARGRRSARLTLEGTGFRVDDGPLRPWPPSDAIVLDGPWLELGEVRLPLHGEEPRFREALLALAQSVSGHEASADQVLPERPRR